MPAAFVHLDVHTEYSINDGLIRIPALIERLDSAHMAACAVSENGNLFSTIKFYRAAVAAGLKPIIGAQLNLAMDEEYRQRAPLRVLCQDRSGYRNLTRLITRSYMEAQHQGIPHVFFDWLREYNAGLIVLSGATRGDIGQAIVGGQDTRARTLLEAWRDAFPQRYYLEIQRIGADNEELYIDVAVQLAQDYGIPLVATNAVRFLEAEDFEAHEARVCIQQGRTLSDPRRPRDYSPQQYLRSAEEMTSLFADLPEAVQNSVYIAQRCNLELTLGQYALPEFPVPDGETLDSYFRRLSSEGLERRCSARSGNGIDAEVYRRRLDAETKVIIDMGFAGYFLIVADFIHWAKEHDIPVGPGRGSGAGSLVAYVLGITDLDPLRYELLFERFLNPERVSLPDFDVDFCMDRRDEVIDYVSQRYGKDRVSQIITYGSMAAKAVVRDVGRVLGFPYGFMDQIAKLIPFDLNMTLERALNEEPRLRERFEQEEDVRSVIELARKLEGLVRNPGKHAGGLVIAPAPLTEFTALYREQGGSATVTQFDMGDVEAVGLVKFDFLGLKTLTIIRRAVEEVNGNREPAAHIDIDAIPLDDADAYRLISSAETTAVFQLESRGMRDLIKRLQPDRFEDLIALVALFRPGPLQSGMVDDYIDRKHGRAPAHYLHPDLEVILKPTHGVILYQEQVMQIAQVLAGYTLGAADLLRRAMGKKKPEEMAEQRAIFTEGAAARAVDPRLASTIFDLMEKFAGYGFNKSHSAAYALVAYQTAWLKTHYPAAFLAAVLSADMDDTDKVQQLLREARRMGIEILKPDVNACAYRFVVAGESAHAVRYGLGAVKGVGASAIEAIVTERDANGPYRDLSDLCDRVDLRRLNRRVLESLIKAGTLDGLGGHRAMLMANLEPVLLWAEQRSKDLSLGQNDLFGASAADHGGQAPGLCGPDDVPPWTDRERLTAEKETLGLYLTGHPIDRYAEELPRLAATRLGQLSPGRKRIAGLVTALRTTNSRRGRMAIMELDDTTGQADVLVYAEILTQFADKVAKDRVLVVEGMCNLDEFTGNHNLVAEQIYHLEEARELFAKELVMAVTEADASNGLVAELQELLGPHRPGRCQVVLNYHRRDALARVALGSEWRVSPSDDLLETLRQKLGDDRVRIEY